MGASDRQIDRIISQITEQPADRDTAPVKRVALFGGTFDPPHIGHLTMAQLTLEQTAVDEVWFLPSPAPPHKLDERHLIYQGRARMVEALIAGYPNLVLSRIEETLPKPSYTVDTVRACIERYPNVEFRFLFGSDSLAQLHTWHEAEALVERIGFIVAVRSGYPYEATVEEVRARFPALRVEPLEMPLLDVSSTWVRERQASRQPLCGLVPDNVFDVWSELATEG